MRHIGVRIYESPHGGRLLGWVSVRVAGKGARAGLEQIWYRRAAEPNAAPDRGGM